MQFEEYLVSRGIDLGALTHGEYQSLLTDYRHFMATAPPLVVATSPTYDLAEHRRQAVADFERESAARQGRFAPPAIQPMPAHRNPHPGNQVRQNPTVEALAAALLLRSGGSLDHRSYQSMSAVGLIPRWLRANVNDDSRQRHMEDAHRYADSSLVDICKMAIESRGDYAFRDRTSTIQAAVSSGALTEIFTTSINAKMLATFTEAGDSTRGWTQSAETANFKTNERNRLEVPPNMSKLPSGGVADHDTIEDTGEEYKIARYAHQFVVDEQDILNDRMNVFADTPRRMGIAAARLRPDLVYAILLANPTLAQTGRALFNVTDGNLDSGSALAIATLKAAITAMFLFQENGINLNIMASHLVVPPTLEFTARELIRSTTIVLAGDTDVERGSSNTLEGRVAVVADARLENGVTDPDSGTAYAGSSSTWFLAANSLPTIEVGYLAGTGRAPQSRSWVRTQGEWGIGWDINMDIGAKALGWRGLHKATG